MSRNQKKRSGYTLIELVVVLLILGIMTAVAAPRYIEATARYRVTAAARRIVADLNHVRGRAMMKGPVEEEWVSFYPALERYEMHDDPDLDHPANEYWVDLSKSAYPVDIVSASFLNNLGVNGGNTIKFDMYGYPKCGPAPTAPLLNGHIVIAAGSEQRTIVIDPVTGKASIQ